MADLWATRKKIAQEIPHIRVNKCPEETKYRVVYAVMNPELRKLLHSAHIQVGCTPREGRAPRNALERQIQQIPEHMDRME